MIGRYCTYFSNQIYFKKKKTVLPKAGQILTKNAFNTWLCTMKDISQENVGKICQSYLDQISVVDQQTLHCKHLKIVLMKF